ncbi:MAG: tetratricopeptide (TPR) repeat protein [Phenylobacterium sp.]|jgi:tetratricopeptide (TPR) repeat protein
MNFIMNLIINLKSSFKSIGILCLMATSSGAALAQTQARDSALQQCLWPSGQQQTITPPQRLFELGSTSGKLFIHNLNAQIEHLQTQPSSQASRIALAHQLWQKGLIYSDMSLINQAAITASQVIDSSATDLAMILRAQINMSMHRFALAQKDLLAVVQPTAKTQALMVQIGLLSGQAAIVPLALNQHSVASAATLAGQYIADEKLQHAEAALARAVEGIEDTNPIPIVALHLVSAKLAAANNDEKLAVAHIRRAVERLPSHVGALEALAAHHQKARRYPPAIACLNLAKAHSPDPHLSGLLADAYAGAGDTQRAKAMNQQTLLQFQQALLRYPHGYAGEAAHYLASHGNTQAQWRQAAKWAAFDANNRPMTEQWLLVANIHMKLNEFASAKATIELIHKRFELAPKQQKTLNVLMTKLNG